MNLIETIISAITISAISGLAWLAYKHPHAYKKMIPIVPAIWLGIYACILSYNMGAIKAFGSGTPIPLTSFIFIGFYLYLMLLSYLPNLLKKEDDKKPK